MSLRFEGLNSALRIKVRQRTATVDVFCYGRWFDRLLDLEMLPKRDGDGYVCQLCEGGKWGSKTWHFKSQAAMRTNHLFEALLAWSNDQLSSADFIVFEGSHGIRSARLASECPAAEADDGWRMSCVPLWCEARSQ